MRYEVARCEKRLACEVARDVFRDKISGEVSAVYIDRKQRQVLAVSGLRYYVPVAEQMVVLLEKHNVYRTEMKTGKHYLFQWSSETKELHVFESWEEINRTVRMEKELTEKIVDLLTAVESWGGRLNEKGELECDLVSPSPGPNYYTNMLLGNRIGYEGVLQCTPKSVVDRLGRGSFRSHADTQVLAARWDYLPSENGFPANRQFYLIESGQIIFYSAKPDAENIIEGKCVHSQNHTIITYRLNCGLEIKRTIFLLPHKEKMPIACEAQMIEIVNHGAEDRDIKLVYTGMLASYSTVCLKSDIIYFTVISESMVVCNENDDVQAVTYHYNPEYEQSDLRFHAMVARIEDELIYPQEYCFDYQAFLGNGSLECPQGAVKLNNRHVRKGPAFFATATPLFIKAGQRAQVDNLTCLTSEKTNASYKGEQTMLEEIEVVHEFLKDSDALRKALEDVKNFTKEYNRFLVLNDEDKEFETYVNYNLPFQVYYQNFVSRSFDQTQKGYREIGFREIQDIFASMYYWIGLGRADIARGFISEWAANVYEFGYANHNFYWKGKEGGASSDDQLWLLQALDRYVSLTGDYDFLKQEVAMADGGKRSLLQTIKAIITYSAKISVGKHGLPLMDKSDWNDCLRLDEDWIDGKEKEKRYYAQLEQGGKFGERFESNYSESVMNGCLLKVAVDAAANIFAHCALMEEAQEMKRLSKDLCDRIQKHAWKGDFFCRALFNREKFPFSYLGAGGDTLSANPEKPGCYYINSVAWSILSGVATEEQIRIMLDTLDCYVRTPFGYHLSSEVAYEKIAKDVGASNFFFGDRENGGIFKHANMMLAASFVKAANEVEDVALAKRLTDTVYWLVDKIVPYATMNTPFTLCGNPRFCTQYNNADNGENIGPTLSGTSTWLLLTIVMLLGLHSVGGKLEFKPLLKDAVKEKTMKFCLENTIYHVRIEKPALFCRTKDTPYCFVVDGKLQESTVLPLFKDGKEHTLEFVYTI